MASIIKVDEIKSQANGSALSIASGGAITVNNGLSGTLSGTISSSTVFPAGGTGNPISVAVIADEKSNNTDGGDAPTGSYVTRVINTEISDPDGIVSIASNQFTLGAGTYLINWSAPALQVNNHQSLLYDITGSAILEVGESAYTSSSDTVVTRSKGSFIHTITSNNVYEIRHQCGTAKTTNGFGVVAAFGQVEIYTLVIIYKLK